MDITLYILDKEGYLDCKRIGNPNNIMYAIEYEDKDFTLTQPPNTHEQWRWIDNKWVADNTAS